MDIDEDEDFYAPDEPEVQPTTTPAAPAPTAPTTETQNAELEEGEEEDSGGEMDEDDDSDIEIVTERKDGTKAPPPIQSKYSDIRNIPQRSTSHEAAVKATPVVKKEETPRQQQQQPQHSASGTEYPAVSTSKIDVNAIPIHKATGKPITQVNIDEDLSENDKPWRQPGTDLSDYFNYGFDEFTWALYAQKQEQLRNDSGANKMMEEMAKMMMGGGMMPGMMPGMPGNPAAAAVPPTPTAPTGPAGGMPGMDGSGIPPEMQAAFMQQMMQQGMDPSQMDPSAMMAMMQQAGGQGGQGQGQGQNFQQGYGGQQQGYGYDQQQQMGGRGNFGGRGRGGRRQW